MPIIDEELFVRCARCGSEAATGVRRTEDSLRESPPAPRAVRCHRCGYVATYEGSDFYHRTVDEDQTRVGA